MACRRSNYYPVLRINICRFYHFILYRGRFTMRSVQPDKESLTMIDNRTAPYAAFVLRAALGVMFIAHALLKYSVFTLPGTAKFFESLGLPRPLAYATFAAELIGGALILPPLRTPP